MKTRQQSLLMYVYSSTLILPSPLIFSWDLNDIYKNSARLSNFVKSSKCSEAAAAALEIEGDRRDIIHREFLFVHSKPCKGNEFDDICTRTVASIVRFQRCVFSDATRFFFK